MMGGQRWIHYYLLTPPVISTLRLCLGKPNSPSCEYSKHYSLREAHTARQLSVRVGRTSKGVGPALICLPESNPSLGAYLGPGLSQTEEVRPGLDGSRWHWHGSALPWLGVL